MLMTGLGYSFLHEHCAREFSTENIVCWKKIETYNLNKPTFHGFEVRQRSHHSAGQSKRRRTSSVKPPFILYPHIMTTILPLPCAQSVTAS